MMKLLYFVYLLTIKIPLKVHQYLSSCVDRQLIIKLAFINFMKLIIVLLIIYLGGGYFQHSNRLKLYLNDTSL